VNLSLALDTDAFQNPLSLKQVRLQPRLLVMDRVIVQYFEEVSSIQQVPNTYNLLCPVKSVLQRRRSKIPYTVSDDDDDDDET